jgi:hypothetical protein
MGSLVIIGHWLACDAGWLACDDLIRVTFSLATRWVLALFVNRVMLV